MQKGYMDQAVQKMIVHIHEHFLVKYEGYGCAHT